MSIAVLIRRMTDAGAPPEAIAIAVEEIEAIQASLEARRNADRDRKRAQRERQKSADVTGQSEDSHGTVTAISAAKVSLDKETTPKPPKEINPIPCVQDARAKGWHRLPTDWVPRPLPGPLQAKVDLWPPGALEDELASFRRWAANAANTNGKGRKLDWDQAWRNWIGRRNDERYSKLQTIIPGLGKTSAAIAGLGDWNDDRPM